MSHRVDINKTEKILLSVITIAFLMVFAPNVTWVLEQFGISIGNNIVNGIIDYISNGGTLVAAFATIAGITLPAWVGVVTAAAGATAA